ncbi:MAG: Protein-O-mannosyltransferase, partial [uncultured Nocardioides sp.]
DAADRRRAQPPGLARRGPVARLDRRGRDRQPGVLPAALAARHPPPVLLRRDLLRQGRLVAAAVRPRPRLRRGRRQDDPQRRRARALEGRPVDGRAPRGRQVADRAGDQGVRDGPLRLADRLRRRRGADGAGDVPVRTARDQLDVRRPRRRLRAGVRRSPPRAVPPRPARHLPGVLPPLRGALRGRRPAVAAGPAGRRHQSCLVASVAGRGGRELRPRRRDQVVRPPGPGRLRPPGVAVERRRTPRLRRARPAAALGPPRRRARLPRPGRGRLGRLRGVVDRVADARRGLRAGLQQHAVHRARRREAVVDGRRAGRGRTRRGHPVAAVAVALPPGRLHVPQRLPQRLHPHLRLEALHLARDGTARRGRRPARHPAGQSGLRGSRGVHVPAPGAAPRQPRRVVGGLPRHGAVPGHVGRGTRLAARGRRGRPGLDLAAVVPLRRPPDLLLLRHHQPAVPGALALPRGGAPAGSYDGADAAADGRGRAGRELRRPGGPRLRLVLADLDRPAHHPRAVDGPDLVRPLDL